jgi:predicted GIY-YIG superfamily endonuclease
MNYTIQEINGRLFKVFPHGGRLLHVVKAKKESGVYMVTQISTGLKYIGSSMDLRQRLKAYSNESGSCRSFALRSIPVLDLRVEVLQYCSGLDRDSVLAVELEWILKLGTVSPNGFNLRCPVTNLKLTKDKIFLHTGRRSEVGQKMFPRGYKVY